MAEQVMDSGSRDDSRRRVGPRRSLAARKRVVENGWELQSQFTSRTEAPHCDGRVDLLCSSWALPYCRAIGCLSIGYFTFRWSRSHLLIFILQTPATVINSDAIRLTQGRARRTR